MCQFFSCVSDGKANVMYFDWELRKKCLSGEIKYSPDSHTSIADYFGYKGAMEDNLNKYEYNPLTKVFTIDQINTKDDSKRVKRICEGLDFKKIVPQLIIKQVVHPFKNKNRKRVTKKDLELLRKWASVWYSVGASVRYSVGASVWYSVGASVWYSIKTSVWDSVRASVWYSIKTSVWDSIKTSVEASVWNSVGASVEAYASSFFNIEYKEGENPFLPAIDLWEKGLVPSFDREKWRLHGANGVVWEGKI